MVWVLAILLLILIYGAFEDAIENWGKNRNYTIFLICMFALGITAILVCNKWGIH